MLEGPVIRSGNGASAISGACFYLTGPDRDQAGEGGVGGGSDRVDLPN